MSLRIIEIHRPKDSKALNNEWFVLENGTDKPFHTKNCSVGMSRPGQHKRRELGTLEPGFQIAPGQKVRVITGNPGRKAHGKPPEDDTTNYHLFLVDSVLKGAGTTLTFSLRSMELARAAYDPKQKSGVSKDAES